MDGYASVAEAAVKLHLSRSKVYDLIKQGKAKAFRVGTGKAMRIPKGELERLQQVIVQERQGFTVADLAKDLAVSKMTIRNAIAKGNLPARERLIGYGFFVTHDDYEQWREQRMAAEAVRAS